MTEEFPTQTTREKDSNKKKREKEQGKNKKEAGQPHTRLCVSQYFDFCAAHKTRSKGPSGE